MKWTCTMCGSRDWTNDSGCPLCITETDQTMTADTITIRQIREILILARELCGRCEEILDQIDLGEISPADAAKEIGNMIEDINNAAK